MSDMVTITGNVAGDPQLIPTAKGHAMTVFRLASTQGWWDRSTGAWTEGQTNWYDVRVFRQLADCVKASVRIGDPVIVTGRLRVREWESNGRRGKAVEIDADAVGHNLRHGTSAFVKAHRPRPAEGGQPPHEGPMEQGPEAPHADDSDSWAVPPEEGERYEQMGLEVASA